MKICSVCKRISATGEDHLDCIQKRRVELENEDLKNKIPEKIDLQKNSNDLGVEIRAILEHLSKEKQHDS